MSKKLLFGLVVASLPLIGFPVFAEGPVDISIVEEVDDGTGIYRDWEDITSAMPGMTYSAIPRIKNNGTISVSAVMCLTESGVDANGNAIGLDTGTFSIEINHSYWTRISGADNSGTVTSPIEVCYKYHTKLEVDEITEPLFSEVYLSDRLGNEYGNATFSLHLDAYAEEDHPDEPAATDETPDETPNEPNTGLFTNSASLTTEGYVFLSIGAVLLISMTIWWLKRAK